MKKHLSISIQRRDFYNSNGLTFNELLLRAAIYTITRSTHKGFIGSNEYLANSLGWTPRHVQRIITRLVEKEGLSRVLINGERELHTERILYVSKLKTLKKDREKITRLSNNYIRVESKLLRDKSLNSLEKLFLAYRASFQGFDNEGLQKSFTASTRFVADVFQTGIQNTQRLFQKYETSYTSKRSPLNGEKEQNRLSKRSPQDVKTVTPNTSFRSPHVKVHLKEYIKGYKIKGHVKNTDKTPLLECYKRQYNAIPVVEILQMETVEDAVVEISLDIQEYVEDSVSILLNSTSKNNQRFHRHICALLCVNNWGLSKEDDAALTEMFEGYELNDTMLTDVVARISMNIAKMSLGVKNFTFGNIILGLKYMLDLSKI